MTSNAHTVSKKGIFRRGRRSCGDGRGVGRPTRQGNNDKRPEGDEGTSKRFTALRSTPTSRDVDATSVAVNPTIPCFGCNRHHRVLPS